MYRSYVVVCDSGAGYARRTDSHDFAMALRRYQECQPGWIARLYGVDAMDRLVLLGEQQPF